MIIYLVRHGQDDNSYRGGWSNLPLTNMGIKQSKKLANALYKNREKYNIKKIYSSDLKRAEQTAKIIADKLKVSIDFIPQFREVNNGDLAGMNNETADKQYPGLYWRLMEWENHYPNGESPKEFYERIKLAWKCFINSLGKTDGNVILVTHGGVINVIKTLVNRQKYSNKEKYEGIPCAKLIPIYEENKYKNISDT